MRLFYRTAILITLAITASGCVKEDEGSRLKPGGTVPSFTVEGPDGIFSSSTGFRNGGLLVFFASYCPTCKTALPEVEKLWLASGEGSLFAVACLSRQGVYDENEQTVATYWNNAGYTMPYYLDVHGEVYYMFAKETIPRIYVVDKSNKITYMSVGNGSITAGEIASELEKALGIVIDL